jgi:hypothetical protein
MLVPVRRQGHRPWYPWRTFGEGLQGVLAESPGRSLSAEILTRFRETAGTRFSRMGESREEAIDAQVYKLIKLFRLIGSSSDAMSLVGITR